MGTADFIAPEQVTDSHSADIRADIYSLGCTLYKLLTGEPPFPGPKYKSMMEKMTGHLRDMPRPIRELRSDAPPGLVAIVSQMMAKDRAARYATPREVAAALAPFAASANLDHLARCAAAADAGQPLPPLPTEPYLSSPLTGTSSSPLAPVLRGEGPGVRANPDSVQVLGTAIRQAIRGPALLVALGLFGVLIALGFVIIRILHNDGTETEVAIPTGASATINPDGSVAVKLPDGSPQKLLVTKRAARRLPQNQWVPLVKSVEDLQAWQRRGSGTVAYINNALQLHDAAVSYPTLAIDLVIRVNIQISVNGPSNARVTLREQPGGSYAAVLEDGKSLVVGVTEKDQWRELQTAAVSIAPDQLVALEFSAVGDVLSVSLDGKQIIEVRDTTHRSGSPGLAVTKGVTLFKDIQVKVLRGEEEIVQGTAKPSTEPAKSTDTAVASAKTADVPQRDDTSPPANPASGYNQSAILRSMTEPDEEDVPWNLPNGAPPPAIFPFDAAQARRHQEAWAKYLGVPVEQTNSLGMKFALVPPGEFEFPFTKDGQTEVTPDTPRARLRLVRPIYVGTTEVTFAQFEKFVDATGYETDAERMGGGAGPHDWTPNPKSTWKTPWQRSPEPNEPVTQVSGNDAMSFCEWLTALECGDLSPLSKPDGGSSGPGIRAKTVAQGGLSKSGDKSPHSKGPYRLPREAEWYFAARAGSNRRYVLGDSAEDLAKVAWGGRDPSQVKDNGVQAVARTLPNAFGLFDVLGNVWEVCGDRQLQQAFLSGSAFWISSQRGAGYNVPGCVPEVWGAAYILNSVGFRIAREITPVRDTLHVSPRRAAERLQPTADDSIVFAQRKRLPLSTNAIVSRSANIPGVRSWSVEMAGHQGQVQAITWSPKGDLIATGGGEGSVRLWDREGRLQRVLLGHEGSVSSVVFSPDGSLLASSDFGGSATIYQVRIWEVATGACLVIIPFDNWIMGLAFSPNGESLAIALTGQWKRLTVVNLRTGGGLESAEESTSDFVAWSPDGSRLMSRKWVGPTICIWDGTTLKKLAELQVSDAEGKIVGLEPGVWSPDGHSIAAPGGDGAWRIWDSETFELRKTLKREGEAPFRLPFGIGGALLLWKQNGQLVTPLATNRLLTWDVERGEVVSEVDIPLGVRFAPSPDESEIVSWHSHRPHLDFLDAETGKSLRRGINRGATMEAHVGLSPDGQRIVTCEEWGMAEIWEADTGRPVARNGGARIWGPTWRPSDGFVAGRSTSSNVGHELSLFDSVTMASAFKLQDEGKGVSSHAWSPDGKLLAAADLDNAIRVWDISNREVINNLVGHEARIWKLAWSPDGKCLASRSEDKTVRLWEPISGRLLATYEEFPQPMHTHVFRQGLTWTPDSQMLWIGLDTHAVQLDVANGQFSPMENFSNGNVIDSLAISVDGKQMIARENYGWTFLRTIGADGSPSRRLLGQRLGRYPVWHPDGRRFLGSEYPEGGYVVGFDIQTNRRLGMLFPWITGDHWMCVSPEGHLRGGHFEPGQTKFDPADTAIPASLKEQIVYVALLDDGSQVTLSPDEFAARFGWQNDPHQAYLLGPTP